MNPTGARCRRHAGADSPPAAPLPRKGSQAAASDSPRTRGWRSTTRWRGSRRRPTPRLTPAPRAAWSARAAVDRRRRARLPIALVLVLWAPWRAAAPPRVTRTTITTSGRSGADDQRLRSRPGALTRRDTRRLCRQRRTQLFVRALDALEPVAIATGERPARAIRLAGWPVGRLHRRRQRASESHDHRRPADHARQPRRHCPRRDVGPRRHDHLRDRQPGDGTAARVGRRRDARGADAARPRAGRSRPLLAGTPARRPRRSLHDHIADGRTRDGPGGGARSAHRDAEGAAARRQPRSLRGQRPPGLRRGGDAARDPLRSEPAGDARHGGAGSAATRHNSHRRRRFRRRPPTERSCTWMRREALRRTRARSCGSIARAKKSPSPRRRAPTSTRASRPTGRASRSGSTIRRTTSGSGTCDGATLTRLTLDPGLDRFPVWTPDGQRIIFASNRGGALNLWWQAADGSGNAERLTTSSNPQFPTGITPDGTAVVFNEPTPTMGSDLLQFALDGTRQVTPLLQTKFDECNGIVSPDGRWLAYDSNSSGSFEVYVRPFPNVGGGQSPVSTAGGTRPLWARNGKELFYVGADGALMRVPVEASGATWNAGTPTKLFEGRYCQCRHVWPHLRRVARRPTVSDDQTRHRRGRRHARDHRRATLGRGTEAPRAREVTGAR